MALEMKLARTRPTSTASTIQLKEDMFSDLSGLIIRDVKVESGSVAVASLSGARPVDSSGNKIVYDCLQTGRNGGALYIYFTCLYAVIAFYCLHFRIAFHYKLSISRDQPSGGSGTSDDVEIMFIPLLDEKRDELLLSLLPDYFTEPLSFMRSAV